MRMDALHHALRSALLVFVGLVALVLWLRRDAVEKPPGLDFEALFETGRSATTDPMGRSAASSTTSSASPALEPGALQAVPLAGRLIATVPRDFDRWRWATQDDLTLLVHRAGGGIDAVVWAEAVRPVAWPSLEVDRFHHEVAPFLASHTTEAFGPRPVALTEHLVETTTLDRATIRAALYRLQGITLGRGLGFVARARAFGGWRHGIFGPQGPELRLARLDGLWGAQSAAEPWLRRVVAGLAEGSPLLAELDRRLDIHAPPGLGESSSYRGSVASTGPSPALLVLGGARVGPGTDIHLAILCRTVPRCLPAHDLAALLRNLRRPDSGEIRTLASGRSSTALRQLADELGWQLQLTEDRLQPDDLLRLDRWVREQAEGQSGGGGPASGRPGSEDPGG